MATTITAPQSPTGAIGTAGDGQASVAFTPPVWNGGDPITGYTATSSPGGFTGTGSTSPIVVTGLTNGTEYTFTVTATNGVGTGSASSASNSVTPTPEFTMVAVEIPPDIVFGIDTDPENTFGSISPATFMGATIDRIQTESDGAIPPDDPIVITNVILRGSGFPFNQNFFTSITIGAVTLNTSEAVFSVNDTWTWNNSSNPAWDTNLVPAAGTYTVTIV